MYFNARGIYFFFISAYSAHMFKFESDVDKATRRLIWIGESALPAAVANTLDNLAFQTKGEATEEFEKDHTIRSTWTQKGMLFEKTRRKIPIARMESRTGNIRDYADVLEKGGTVRPRKTRLMAPTMAARRGNVKKRIAPTFRLERLKPRRMPTGSRGLKRRFAAMLNIARKENYFGPFLITKSDVGVSGARLPRGIFVLAGAGRKKRGGGKIKMIRKIQAKATITGHSFIKKSAARVGKKMPEIYVRNAERIVSRAR